MSTPIGTQILDVIDDRLKNIRNANGYFTTYGKIRRARLKPFTPGDLPSINYWIVNDSLDKPGNRWEDRVLSVFIEYHSLTRDESFSDVVMELAADINIALNRSPTLPKVTDKVSPRLGRIVSIIQCTNATPVIGEGQSPWCAIGLDYAITYRVDPSAPFTLIQ